MNLRSRFHGIRATLSWLLLLAILPSFGVTLFFAFEQRALAERAVQLQAAQLVARAARDQNAQLEGARQLLIAIAQLDLVRSSDLSACSALLARLLPQYPMYANLGVVGSDGTMWCSALPAAGTVTAADRGWFQRAVQTGEFSVGGYQVGRVSGKATLNAAYPIWNESGTAQGTVFAALDAQWLSAVAARVPLPPNGALTIFDEQGIIVAHAPDPEQWVGKALPEAQLVRTALSVKEGEAELPGVDGVTRLYAFCPLAPQQGAGLHISVGFPKDSAYAVVNEPTLRAVLVQLAVVVLTLVVVQGVSDKWLLQPVAALVEATRRLRNGDVSARSGMHSARGELGILAGAFDELAATLEQSAVERRRSDDQLHLQNTALEAAANTIVITDRDGTIHWTNPAFTALTGYTELEAIGQNPRLLSSGRQDAAFYRSLWETIHAGKIWHGELINRRKDGSHYTEEMTITPVRRDRDEITHFIAIKQDVTERKRAEKYIQDLNVELEVRVRTRTALLESANKELEAFAYSVSHDLRAPLRSIDGFAQALTEECADRLDPAGKDYLRRVRAASARMGELIDDLLALARVSRGEMRRETIDLGVLARTVAAALQRRSPDRQVELVVAGALEAHADARLVRIALENLLDNAWKYTSSQPHARVEVASLHAERERVFCVRDNGVGFDMRYAGKLFGPFERLHSQQEFPGTGIGLATVERIVHRHGGRIWAQSTLGQGSTFFFTLGEPPQRPD